MSFKEVKELRKAGKLDEALEMALQDFEADPQNVWNRRSLGWVYYDFLKSEASFEQFDLFVNHLEKLIEIELEDEDKIILYNNTASQIGKLIFNVYKQDPIDFVLVDQLYNVFKRMHFYEPNNQYSFLISAFIKKHQNWGNAKAFIEFVGFDFLNMEDYLSEVYNGNTKASLAESLFSSYSKLLLSLNSDIHIDKILYKEEVERFLPKLKKVINDHPEYEFLPLYEAKLLLKLNRKNEVLEAFLPFAKRKKNEFWVWEVIAEVFEEDKDNYFACLCKALSVPSKEEYIVSLRVEFAKELIKKEKFPEAKFEIEKVIQTRKAKGWKLTDEIIKICNSQWYNSTQASSNNNTLYNQNSEKAEQLLFSDIPEETVVVEFINKEKQVLNFVVDEAKKGQFKYKGILKDPKIGDVLALRLDRIDGGRYNALTARKGNVSECKAIKPFEGKVKKSEDREFAFVNDLYIHASLVEKYKLQNNLEISGQAILSYNKKERKLGLESYSN